MIFNENGEMLNEDYYLLEYLNRETELDILLNESFNDFKKSVVQIVRKMLDGISGIIDWIQRIPYGKQIDMIKKNRDKIIENIRISNECKKYISSSGYDLKWIDNFNKACKDVNSDTTVEGLKKTLYEGKEDTWFKNDKSTIDNSTRNYKSEIVFHALDIHNIASFRKAYSEVKALNASLNKGEKIKVEVIRELHSYLINAIKTIKNLSTECIKVCIEALKNNELSKIILKKSEPVKYKSIKQIRKLKDEKHGILKDIYQGIDPDDIYIKQRALGHMTISIFSDVANTIMTALHEDGVSNIVWSNISLRLDKLSFISIPITTKIREKYKNNISRAIQETYNTNCKILDDWFDDLEKITVEEIERELQK